MSANAPYINMQNNNGVINRAEQINSFSGILFSNLTLSSWGKIAAANKIRMQMLRKRLTACASG